MSLRVVGASYVNTHRALGATVVRHKLNNGMGLIILGFRCRRYGTRNE